MNSKYHINNTEIQTILSWITSNEISIPEIQRPFVWKPSQVRDLIDSLFRGYPVGYIIVWKNPDIRLKSGEKSQGKKILIDGQQRITALAASMLGQEIVDEKYKKRKIQISANPYNYINNNGENIFEVHNQAIERDNEWIKDISMIFDTKVSVYELVENYCKLIPSIEKEKIHKFIEEIRNLLNRQIGVMELESELDIEVVTDIFTRINSKGVRLNQADFAMSKIASSEQYDGVNVRKAIDYFAHLSLNPEFFENIKNNDKEFVKTEYLNLVSWLGDDKKDLYDPDYGDIIRVIFTSQFERGKLSDFVSLLSGRNFENRTFEENIVEETFDKLKIGILNFMNETNYKRFLMIIESTGFRRKLIRSQNTLNFAYILYLKLKDLNINSNTIERCVRKWFVMSILTGRYSGSPESYFEFDIKNIVKEGIEETLEKIEKSDLSDAFWNNTLIQRLETPASSSPYFHVFVAAQCRAHKKGFLSSNLEISTMVDGKSDVHHIFPKEYLKKSGYTQNEYNQIANYCYTQQEINIRIGKLDPKSYLTGIFNTDLLTKNSLSLINSESELASNFKDNAIPNKLVQYTSDDYKQFLTERRILMSEMVKDYYFSL